MAGKKKTLGIRGKRSKHGSDSDATIADDDLQVQPPQPLPKPKKKQSKAKGVSARKPAKGKSQPPAEVVEDSEEEEEEEGEEEEEHEEQSDESSQPPVKKKAKKAPKKTVKPKAKTVKLARDSEIDLLDALKKVPALWSSGHEYLHFTKECKIPMWKKLGDDFNLSVEQVKQWYKNIRTQLGKYTDLPPSGSGAVKLTPRAEFIVQHASFIKGEITRIVGRVNTTLRYDRQKMNELETKRSMQAQLRPSQSTTSGSQEVSASQGTPAFPNLGSDNEFEVDQEEPGTSTAGTAPVLPVRPRSTPPLAPLAPRVYPQNRTKIAETNRLNDALQDQIRTTVTMQSKLTAWLDKHTDTASNERLMFHQSVGQTSLRIDECHWNLYRRDVNNVLDKYLNMAPPPVMNLSAFLNEQGTPVAARRRPLGPPPPTPRTTAAAHSIIQGGNTTLAQVGFAPLDFLSQLQSTSTITSTAANFCGIDVTCTGATPRKPHAVKVSSYAGEGSADMYQSTYSVNPTDPNITHISQIQHTQGRSTSPAPPGDLTTLECIEKGLIKCPLDSDEEEDGQKK